MVDMVKQTPAYKNKLKALELQKNGAVSNKKKGQKYRSRLVLGGFHLWSLWPPALVFKTLYLA